MSNVLNYYSGGNVAQTRAAKAQAIRDLKQVKVRALRIEKRAQIKNMRAEHKRMIETVRGRFDAKIAELLAKVDEKRAELKGSKLAKKHNRERQKGRATGAERRQEIDEEVENDVRGWRPDLVPLWQKVRVGFPNRPGMSRFEAFQHYVHENQEAVDLMQAERQVVNDAEMACKEAKHLAGKGDDAARAWAEENCGMPVEKVRPRPKGTPTQRTPSLYASGERPPEPGRAAKGRTLKRGPKAQRGQQGLTVGKMKAASLIDTPLDQIPF